MLVLLKWKIAKGAKLFALFAWSFLPYLLSLFVLKFYWLLIEDISTSWIKTNILSNLFIVNDIQSLSSISICFSYNFIYSFWVVCDWRIFRIKSNKMINDFFHVFRSIWLHFDDTDILQSLNSSVLWCLVEKIKTTVNLWVE